MSKRNFVGLSAKGTHHKKSRNSFKLEWLKVKVTTDTPDFSNVKFVLLVQASKLIQLMNMQLESDWKHGNWITVNDIHVENVQILYNRKHGISVKSLLTEKLADRKAHLDHAKRLQTNEEQIHFLMNNVLLGINMNASMLSVQTIHDHIGKYVSIPDSWRSKNYAFEFVAAIT